MDLHCLKCNRDYIHVARAGLTCDCGAVLVETGSVHIVLNDQVLELSDIVRYAVQSGKPDEAYVYARTLGRVALWEIENNAH